MYRTGNARAGGHTCSHGRFYPYMISGTNWKIPIPGWLESASNATSVWMYTQVPFIMNKWIGTEGGDNGKRSLDAGGDA